ncbi:unnamed protein product [Brassica rapa]|uniref:Uncharacterized protein n=2 Tax=Brassica TaxID=3705 RepID=A0A3P6CGM3_BRACM|nr:unnamed protein product [Brassica napus]CAG7907158.1 unnamed protein product [Brassica rapa]CDY45605.1 BnaA04g14720D [Brassica napus]VDD13570.1 unnamed protein product [Brassica rapa]
MAICMCCESRIVPKSIVNPWISPRRTKLGFVAICPSSTTIRRSPATVRASAVDSPESSSNFAKRMEQAWLISQQPRPVGCSSCNSKGHVECKWCAGTGFFILGDNMLCQVPSRNTSCVICSGQGSACCSDCKGTGFRAKWLEKPPVPL